MVAPVLQQVDGRFRLVRDAAAQRRESRIRGGHARIDARGLQQARIDHVGAGVVEHAVVLRGTVDADRQLLFVDAVDKDAFRDGDAAADGHAGFGAEHVLDGAGAGILDLFSAGGDAGRGLALGRQGDLVQQDRLGQGGQGGKRGAQHQGGHAVSRHRGLHPSGQWLAMARGRAGNGPVIGAKPPPVKPGSRACRAILSPDRHRTVGWVSRPAARRPP